MRVLYLENYGDYNALEFMEKYNGVEVTHIISKLADFEDEDEFGLYVHEFDDVDLRFIEFVRRNIFDHDDQKHKHFWLETETITW